MPPILLPIVAAALVVVGFATTGCAVQGCAEPADSGTLRLQLEARDDNPLIVDATVELAEAAPIYLEYGSSRVGWLRTATTEPGTLHQIPILRLRADTTYQVRAFGLNARGCPSTVAEAEFKTDQLPTAFRRLAFQETGSPSSALTLMDTRVNQGDLTWLLAFDREGEIVWYYAIPPEILRSAGSRRAYGLARLPNGNLVYLAKNFGVEEITPDGRVVRRIRLDQSKIHHDLVAMPDGRVLFIGAEERLIDDTPNGGPPDLRMLGGTLHVLDLESGAAERVWSALDALDFNERPPNLQAYQSLTDAPEEGVLDWNHINTVTFGSRGNILLSLRHMDQIISLSTDFKTVEWRLGGLGSSFTFPDPTDRFYGQHAVSETPDGHILMFDNGNFRPEGEYSRALELKLDFSSMTAHKTWEYRHQPDLFADRLSSVAMLPNGNRLVNFGFRAGDPAAPIALLEARPDGTSSWTHWTSFRGARTARYRAYPLDSLAGETQLEPTAVGRFAGNRS